jgi:hypothetical protein
MSSAVRAVGLIDHALTLVLGYSASKKLGPSKNVGAHPLRLHGQRASVLPSGGGLLAQRRQHQERLRRELRA